MVSEVEIAAFTERFDWSIGDRFNANLVAAKDSVNFPYQSFEACLRSIARDS